MNRLSIYFLTYNRIHENIFKSLNVINSLTAELKSCIDVYLVNDNSNMKDYEAELNKILKSKKYGFINYKKNPTNYGIIGNYLRIVSECDTKYIQYICDDDYIQENIEVLLKKILFTKKKENISSYFWKYNELRDKHIIRTSKLMSFRSDFKTSRMIKFLFNQSDMYMHGIHSVKYLKKFRFSKFLLVKGPISWGYLMIVNQLYYGKIIVYDNDLWCYNSNSEKHYLRDSSKSKVYFFYLYLLREIELHIRFLFQSKNIIVLIFLPFILSKKIFKRIL